MRQNGLGSCIAYCVLIGESHGAAANGTNGNAEDQIQNGYDKDESMKRSRRSHPSRNGSANGGTSGQSSDSEEEQVNTALCRVHILHKGFALLDSAVLYVSLG